MCSSLRYMMLVCVIAVLAPQSAAAQNGWVAGRVTDASDGSPLPAATVQVLTEGNNAISGAIADANGEFRVTGVPAGTYTVAVTLLGYEERRLSGVVVRAGEGTTLAVAMTTAAVTLNPVIVSASRRQEKALEAPATVQVVETRAIVERPTVTPVDHLRSIPAVDIIQQGVQSTNVVARGFNNIFSTSLHTLTDYRLASVPSLRVNLMHFIPANNEDIERMEVVLGPGAALYGPNTANGVLHILTRSPLEHQGTVVSAAGGERSIFMGNFRSAHLLNPDLGVKVSGQYVRGEEWPSDPAKDQEVADELVARAIALSVDPTTRIGLRDPHIERYGVEGRADWRFATNTTGVFSAGYTQAVSGIELTGVGAGQTKDWKYSYLQARASRDRLFGQVYLNMSDAGDTYIVRNGLAIVDDSKTMVAQIQNGSDIGLRQTFTYGADLVRTMPDTRGTIHGRNEADDEITEFGAYVQSETELSRRFDLVAAGRVDHHSRLENEAIFSPRAALVFKPSESQNFRLTYNRAFSTPVSFNLFLDLDYGAAPGALGQVLGYRVRAMGTEPSGLTFVDEDGRLVGMRSPFNTALGGTAHDVRPVETGILWDLGISALERLGRLDRSTADNLRSLNPTEQQIGIDVLNPATSAQTPLASTQVSNVSRIQESRTSTIELGWKGIIGDRLLISAAVWREDRNNFTSPLTPFTPLLKLDSMQVYAFSKAAFMQSGMPEEQAEVQALALRAGFRALPLAVGTPLEVSPSDTFPSLIASYRNFGEVTLGGADLSATALINRFFSVMVAGSLVNKDHFRFEQEGYLVGLNAPKRKATVAVTYRDSDRGVGGEVRMRTTSSFPVSSAPHSGTACIASPNDVRPLPGFEVPCVEAATLFDVNLSYRLPVLRGATAQLSVTNVFDTPYRSFVSVPEIGRFALLRLRYEF